MKSILIILNILHVTCLFGQEYFDNLRKSVLYLNFEEADDKRIYNWILIKKFDKDTVINEETYKKYNWLKFKDYDGVKQTYPEYELLTTEKYILLDQKFNIIHRVDVSKDSQQTGIIFGHDGIVGLEYIDTRSYTPRDSFIPDEITPKKFYLDEHPDIYLIYQPGYQLVETFMNGHSITEYLIDDIFSKLSESIENLEPIKPQCSLQIGDAIQIVYRSQYFNDSLGVIEYEGRQIITMEYYKDTILNNLRTYVLSTSNYNYSFGQEKIEEDNYITVTDSGYWMNFTHFFPAIPLKPEFKIDTLEMHESTSTHASSPYMEPFVSLKGYIYYPIGDKKFPLVLNWLSNSPYVYYNLTDFPSGYIEFGNVQGEITYLKLRGQEYGKKLMLPEKSDETHIRKITQTQKNEIEIQLFLNESCKVGISIGYNYRNDEELFSEEMTSGKHTLTLKTKKLKQGNSYKIEMHTKCSEGHSGHLTTGFIARMK